MKTFAKVFGVVLLVIIVLVYIGSGESSGSSDEEIVDALQFRGANNEVGERIGSVSSGVEFIRHIVLPDEYKKERKYLDDVLSVQIVYANGVSKSIRWSAADEFEYQGQQLYGLTLIWRASIMDYSTSKPKKIIFTFRHSSGNNVITREMV